MRKLYVPSKCQKAIPKPYGEIAHKTCYISNKTGWQLIKSFSSASFAVGKVATFQLHW
jgi:hypothetical protein